MVVITKDGVDGEFLPAFGSTPGQSLRARMIRPITRWRRAVHAERYMEPRQRHLDIGCGDGFFLRRSRCEERYGLDEQLGDEVTDTLEFDDGFFDYVTMLAVIEHILFPEFLVREIARVMKPGGRFIITTPKRGAEFFIKFYVKNIGEEHETYFDLERMRMLTEEYFKLVGHHTFIFGLNQAFCFEKIG